MNVKKLISGAVLGLVVLLFIVWWGFIRAPGPAQVCQHIVEVALREADEQDMSDDSQVRLVEAIHASCIEHKRNKILLRGRIKYAEYAKCVMSSQTSLEIGHC